MTDKTPYFVSNMNKMSKEELKAEQKATLLRWLILIGLIGGLIFGAFDLFI